MNRWEVVEIFGGLIWIVDKVVRDVDLGIYLWGDNERGSCDIEFRIEVIVVSGFEVLRNI